MASNRFPAISNDPMASAAVPDNMVEDVGVVATERSNESIDLRKLFTNNKVHFETITPKEVGIILLKGGDVKKRLCAQAVRSGTDKVSWKGMVIRLRGDAEPSELTWPRFSAIVSLWGYFGKLNGTPCKEGGAMGRALSRTGVDRFDTFFSCLLTPGYHMMGGILFHRVEDGWNNPLEYTPAPGDVGYFLAGALQMDYLIYCADLQKGDRAEDFAGFVKSCAGVKLGSILSKAILQLDPELLTAAEAEHMSKVTTLQLRKTAGGVALERAREAFKNMQSKIFGI